MVRQIKEQEKYKAVVERAKRYNNSCNLNLYNTSKYIEIKDATECLYQLMGNNQRWDSGQQKLKWHIEFFITNLYVVHFIDPAKYISYSKSRNMYSKTSMYNRKFNLSYEYSIKRVIAFLLFTNFIEIVTGFNKPDDTSKSRSPKMRATQKLIDLIEKDH